MTCTDKCEFFFLLCFRSLPQRLIIIFLAPLHHTDVTKRVGKIYLKLLLSGRNGFKWSEWF